jgi:aspartate aminotransferase
MVEEFEKRSIYMYERINAIEGISCNKPEGAFYVYTDISNYLGKELCGEKLNSSLDFAKIMLEKGHVAVIPGAAFGTDNYIRLSYATSMEIIKNGLDTFESFVKENLK